MCLSLEIFTSCPLKVTQIPLTFNLAQNIVRTAVRPLIVGASSYLNGKKMLCYRCAFYRNFYLLTFKGHSNTFFMIYFGCSDGIFFFVLIFSFECDWNLTIFFKKYLHNHRMCRSNIISTSTIFGLCELCSFIGVAMFAQMQWLLNWQG